MSETIFEGIGRIWYVPSINNKAAPSVAEITAGTDISDWVTKDGLDRPQTGKTADAGDVGSAFDKTVPGSYGGNELSLTIKRKSTAVGNATGDTAYTTLARLTVGYIVVGNFGFSGANHAPVAGDHCEVWPIIVISRSPMKTAANAIQKAEVKCSISGDPQDEATVV